MRTNKVTVPPGRREGWKYGSERQPLCDSKPAGVYSFLYRSDQQDHSDGHKPE